MSVVGRVLSSACPYEFNPPPVIRDIRDRETLCAFGDKAEDTPVKLKANWNSICYLVFAFSVEFLMCCVKSRSHAHDALMSIWLNLYHSQIMLLSCPLAFVLHSLMDGAELGI